MENKCGENSEERQGDDEKDERSIATRRRRMSDSEEHLWEHMCVFIAISL